ncbi:MAG TPA: amidophosphoribosyltransferase, partial [bacterium]|nr:amidophosphoribosyltransferase [bacterium]
MIRHCCGIFGVFGHRNAVELTYLGLYALQHRGQESAGIIASDGKRVTQWRGMGLVSEVFTRESLQKLKGDFAIGHVRYSTTGSSTSKNIQPFLVEYAGTSLAVAHNGNIVNAGLLRQKLEASGSIFQTTMDSELLIHLIAKSQGNFKEKVIRSLKQLQGAYSVLVMTEKQFLAGRDPHGFRPLWLGRIDGAFVVASETCAFDLIQAKPLREILPGEVVFFDARGCHSYQAFSGRKHSFCIFEHIYFARPDSNIFGGSVARVREKLDINLAREHPVPADMVIPVPDSGTYAALGYARHSGIPFEMAFVRNHYIGRTFIHPAEEIRGLEVKIKLNPVAELIQGKRIVVVEDSIVRGTTSSLRMKTLKNCGAREIHMRVSCPPLCHPCFYGIDFPTETELAASTRTVEQIRKRIGVDTLAYLSLEGML